MDALTWILIVAFFAVGFIGLIYPIIPSVLFIFGGFFIYGFFNGFGDFSWWFWAIELLFVVLLFAADTIANVVGVKKYGGSKAAVWGSTIGLLVGPFLIPFLGIILGPFIGAVIAECVVMKLPLNKAIKAGFGSVIGFLTSVVTKGIIQVVMIIIFLIVVL